MAGSRFWRGAKVILNELQKCKGMTHLAHGDCRGTDKIAKHIILKYFPQVELRSFPAQWGEYGQAAGPIRNGCMLRTFEPELVLVFHTHLRASSGTKHMVWTANDANVPIKLIHSESSGDCIWLQNRSQVQSFSYYPL